MSWPTATAFSVLVVSIATIVLAYLVRMASPFEMSWREVYDEWQEAESGLNRAFLLFSLVLPFLLRKGLWVLPIAFATAGFTVCIAMAATGQEVVGPLQEIKKILKDFYCAVERLVRGNTTNECYER